MIWQHRRQIKTQGICEPMSNNSQITKPNKHEHQFRCETAKLASVKNSRPPGDPFFL